MNEIKIVAENGVEKQLQCFTLMENIRKNYEIYV